MAGNVTISDEEILSQAHTKALQAFTPVIIGMSILSLFGMIGNGFAFGFYGFNSKKSPTVLLIAVLAVADFSVCLILIHAIIQFTLNVYYSNVYTCKIFHFFLHWGIASSVLVLGTISIDRYRRICHPLAKQIEIGLAKKLAIVMVAVGCVLSIRMLIVYDTPSFPVGDEVNTTATGHYCTTTDDPGRVMIGLIFYNVEAVIIGTDMLLLITTYGRIVWKICRSGKPSSNEPAQKDNHDPSEAGGKHNNANVEANKDWNPNIAGKTPGKPKVKSSLKKTERSITILMLIVSIGFIISLLPFFIIKLGIQSDEEKDILDVDPVLELFLNFVHVNSALNPVVYCVFNPQFRKYVADIISKCKSDKNI